MDWNCLLLLLVTSCVCASSKSFPDSLYPKDLTKEEFFTKCPSLFDDLSWCVTKYEECFGIQAAVPYCEKKFTECLKNESNNQECRKFVDDIIFTIHENGPRFKKEIIEKKTKPAVEKIKKGLKPISKEYQKMIKACGVESKIDEETNRLKSQLNSSDPLLNTVLPFFALQSVEPFIEKSEECQLAIDEFRSAMEHADSETVRHFKIPFSFWFLGTEYGPIGKVITRLVSNEVCHFSVPLDFNQHGAAYLDCYDNRREKTECDEDYFKQLHDTLSTIGPEKVTCALFVDLMKTIHFLRGTSFYEESSKRHNGNAQKINYKGKGFDASENSSLTRRDTITRFIGLERSAKSEARVSIYFEDVSKECGNSRNVVTSCGFQYEHCVYNQNGECKTKFSVCLSKIYYGMSRACQNSVDVLKKYLYPSTTKEKIAEVGKWTVLIFALMGTFGFFVVVAYVFINYRERIRYKFCPVQMEEQRNAVGNEEVPLVDILIQANEEQIEVLPNLEEGADNNTISKVDSDSTVPGSISNAESRTSNDEEDFVVVEEEIAEIPNASLDTHEENNPSEHHEDNNSNLPVIETEAPTNNQENQPNGGIKTETDSVAEFNAFMASVPSSSNSTEAGPSTSK